MGPHYPLRSRLAKSWLALILMLLLPFATVGAQSVHDQASTTVVMAAGDYTPTAWTHPDAQHKQAFTALRVLADKFKQQTGITIKFIKSGSATDWTAWLASNIAGGTAPDVSFVPQGPDKSGFGWFMNMDSRLAQPNPFVPGNKHWGDLWYTMAYKQSVGVGNHHYLLLINGNYPYIVIGIMYNKALTAKAGVTAPPTTWEEWMHQLAKIKAAGIPAMAPWPGEAKSGSVWPMWSTLLPPFMAYLLPTIDTNHDGIPQPLEVAHAVVSGLISMSNPHMQAAWLQYKRQLSYYLPGWNATDVEAVWTQGKLAERYAGFWELNTERSNTQIKFPWAFFPPVVVTKATSPQVTWAPKWAPTGSARLAQTLPAMAYAVIASSVKAHANLDAVTKWLQFITTPQADEFIVNENPTSVPIIKGATPDPLWNQLNEAPVPDFTSAGGLPGIDPFQFFPEQQTHLQHEVILWANGDESDKAFFTHVQDEMLGFARRFIKESQKAK